MKFPFWKAFLFGMYFIGAVSVMHPARAQSPDAMPVASVNDEAVLLGAAHETTDTPDIYLKARVVKITEEGTKRAEDGSSQDYQKLELELLEGPNKGDRILLNHGGSFAIDAYQIVAQGDVVILTKPAHSAREDVYYIADHYRNGRLAIVAGIFFILAILFGGWRGFTAILGMLFSTAVIFYGIAPRVLAGSNVLPVVLVGGAIITVVSLYISHGFSRRTSVAVGASLVTLVLAAIFNYCAVIGTRLTGGGSEEAFYLQLDGGAIDLRGLLLGGIMIGVLGVLDDITTAQTAAVEEISLANPELGFKDLYRRGLSVGREHIASLVNTLVLAYVGASFPVVLLYILNKNISVWLIINSNFIAEEIVRTIVGSTALVIAVPLTTVLAAYVFSTKKIPPQIPGVQKKMTREEKLELFWHEHEDAT